MRDWVVRVRESCPRCGSGASIIFIAFGTGFCVVKLACPKCNYTWFEVHNPRALEEG